MQAARLTEPGRVELIDVPRPALQPGEVLVRVAAASICGSDLSAFQGLHPRIRPPTILGHEFAGTVAQIGPEVENVTLGMRACAEPNLACGHCRYCLRGLPNICLDYKVIGEAEGLSGACAEFVKVPADHLYHLPDRVSFEEGALVQPLSIAYHAVRDRAEVADGELVLILGAGPIGLGVMLVAKSFGARTIVADLLDYRLDMARGLGADVVVNSGTEDLAAVVHDESDGYGVHVAFEAVGGAQEATFDQAVHLTARAGRVIVLGSFASNSVPLRMVDFKFRELELRGSQGHPNTFRPVLDLIALGALPARRLITHRLPLAEISEAFRLLDSKAEGVMKIVVEP
jgi:2-desacetyl-2-hydroxyethyl bacteriochlorophyllide A dehydrogenase